MSRRLEQARTMGRIVWFASVFQARYLATVADIAASLPRFKMRS
jgi:hypothetical protein